MKANDLAVSAERHWEETRECYALSFWTVPGLSAAEIAEQVEAQAAGLAEPRRHPLPHPKMRCAPAGAVRRLGYAVMYSEPRPMHVSVILPSPPSDTDWAAIDEVFGPPTDNPVKQARR